MWYILVRNSRAYNYINMELILLLYFSYFHLAVLDRVVL